MKVNLACSLALCATLGLAVAPQGPSRGALSSGILRAGRGPQSHGLASYSPVAHPGLGGCGREALGSPSQILHPLLAKLLKTDRGVGVGPLKWQKLVLGRPGVLASSRRQQPCKGKEDKISSKWVKRGAACRVTALRIVGTKAQVAQECRRGALKVGGLRLGAGPCSAVQGWTEMSRGQQSTQDWGKQGHGGRMRGHHHCPLQVP